MKILLIRHGQSEADLLDVHEGRANYSLTPLGTIQASKMSKWVKKRYKPDLIWTSTLNRAKETAEILSKETGVPIKEEEGLKEFNNGVLAGMKRSEAKIQYPEPIGGRKPHERIKDGESELEFRLRAEITLSKILSESEGMEFIVIVSHGGMISNLLKSFLGLPIHNRSRFLTGDTGVHYVVKDGNYLSIVFLNSQEHLQEE
ncbi:histidine phosphatase family protein [Neobacillus sp. D3-1R]|uniref:histidine phosphatase family protein n=1 Tax=Neobacillus sp. D3-1R TaxID=3445778 RepID=UPI003F9F3E36